MRKPKDHGVKPEYKRSDSLLIHCLTRLSLPHTFFYDPHIQILQEF